MKSRKKSLTNAVLTVLVVVAVLALAGVSFAGNGKGKDKGKDKGKGDDKAQSASSHEYGSGGKQYGHHKVLICHKGHTIRVAPPAVKAHLRHHDKLGAC
jgi:hypothetical protein